MKLKTCVEPSGKFTYSIHKPSFRAENLREKDYITSLGRMSDGRPLENQRNFPQNAVEEPGADHIFEVLNPFPFRGATYIIRSAAEKNARNPARITLPKRPRMSFSDTLKKWFKADELTEDRLNTLFQTLPEPLQLALAANTTDPEDLSRMAELCGEFIHEPISGRPTGLVYEKDNQGRIRPKLGNHTLFDVLANNIYLPDDYKEAMVLKPGAQGPSEIVGEWLDENNKTHVFEYLRRNSYIPWGHYAANMAHDAIRYRTEDLTIADMTGMRGLYYQRTYMRVAEELGIPIPCARRCLTLTELEDLRKKICDSLVSDEKRSALSFNSTLWGWNFGFDYTPSHYRMHGSHQQVHQQFALIPRVSQVWDSDAETSGYACGDLIRDFIRGYREQTGKAFFDTYIRAIRSNTRMDGNDTGEKRLVLYENDDVILFVPKAQTSQWELQLMTLKNVGNILETDTRARSALDQAMLIAIRTLGEMGARMITTIEYSKRFDSEDTDQRLLYSFLPKLPESPGAFTEAQLRWINGHYPEDFAAACRKRLPMQNELGAALSG